MSRRPRRRGWLEAPPGQRRRRKPSSLGQAPLRTMPPERLLRLDPAAPGWAVTCERAPVQLSHAADSTAPTIAHVTALSSSRGSTPVSCATAWAGTTGGTQDADTRLLLEGLIPNSTSSPFICSIALFAIDR